VRNGVATEAVSWLRSLSDNPTVILLFVLGFLFLLGLALEPVPALILAVPILNPITQAMGFDPLSFGIATIMILVLGSVTPPVGVLAMIACRIAGISYGSTLGVLMPYTLLWATLGLVTAFVPILTNWLPSMIE
jgi:TRAP-type C4-dicarboxylate transport system permease large subunit